MWFWFWHDLRRRNDYKFSILPSYAPSEASGMEGDADADEAALNDEELIMNDGIPLDGEWLISEVTHGDGEDEALHEPPGQFGILAGNWGGMYQSCRAHIDYDVKSSAASVVMAQEATQDLLDNLQTPGVEGIAEEGGPSRGGGVNWQKRPTSQFYGFRGPEEGPSVLICARKSLVAGMRLLYFKLRRDGPYTVTQKPNKDGTRKEPKEKIAQSRIMIVAC